MGLLEYGCCREYTGLGATIMDHGELHRMQGLLATLGHEGWDCRGHGDSEGLQGIMVAYRGTAGSESCGLGIIL